MNMQRMAAILSVGLASGACLAQNTIVVPTDIPTLTLALNPAVSGLQPGDTIELTTGAVYFDPYTVTTPDITIRAAAGQTIDINPFGVGPAFTVDIGNGSLTLEGLTIRNGQGAINGGGVDIDSGGLLTLSDCDFIDNNATTGGAVYALECDVVVVNSRFTNNSATNIGGAIRTLRGDLTITGSSFEGNSSDGAGGAIQHTGDNAFSLSITDTTFQSNTTGVAGGALSSASAPSVTLERVDFLDNVALGIASEDTGGALISATPDVLLRECSFERNLCAGSGGALRFSSAAGSVIDCRFVDNAASSGGAFQAVGAGAFARIYNSVFEGNSARRPGGDSAAGGGAIVVNSSGARVDVYNSLFVSNTAVTGGAITAFDAGVLNAYNCTMVGNDANATGGAIRRLSATAAVVINNSIFTGNLPMSSQVAIAGTGTDEVYFSIVEGGYAGPGAGNLDADPMFVGASLGDYRLMPGSPAIDAGSSIRYVCSAP